MAKLYSDKNNQSLRRHERKASKDLEAMEKRFYQSEQNIANKKAEKQYQEVLKEVYEDILEEEKQTPAYYGYKGDVKCLMTILCADGSFSESVWIIDPNQPVYEIIDAANQYRDGEEKIIEYRCKLTDDLIIEGKM